MDECRPAISRIHLSFFIGVNTCFPSSVIVIIETVSSIIRPATLAVRLAANMIAGHLLLALLGGQGSLSLSKGAPIISFRLNIIIFYFSCFYYFSKS
jgi:F0F1-type ATP synthase membrane subunit a